MGASKYIYNKFLIPEKILFVLFFYSYCFHFPFIKKFFVNSIKKFNKCFHISIFYCFNFWSINLQVSFFITTKTTIYFCYTPKCTIISIIFFFSFRLNLNITDWFYFFHFFRFFLFFFFFNFLFFFIFF